MWVALNILGAAAFLALCVALVAVPARRYQKRREAHYEANPDPLFQRQEP